MLRRTLCPRLHTRFPGVPPTPTSRDTNAGHALLSFNVMVASGVRPDVVTYTRLIEIMARAGREWQAYKLFARMLEQGMEPIPETYAALLRATSPRRKRLVMDIEVKMKEAVSGLPAKLAEETEREMLKIKESAARDIQKVDAGTSVIVDEKATITPPPTPFSYATVAIGNPSLTWDTFKEMQTRSERNAKGPAWVSGEEKDEAMGVLENMHEEELQTFLAVHKQLRHGDKNDLVARILELVPRAAVLAMFKRRKGFFTQVKEQLEQEMESLRKEMVVLTPPLSSSSSSPPIVWTPWGFIKKPAKQTPNGTPRNPFREHPLSEEENAVVEKGVAEGTLDILPIPLLKRYARQHNVKWKRKVMNELYDNVAFHVKQGHGSLVHVEEETESGPSSTTFDVLRAVTRYATEVQAVDNKEITSKYNFEQRRSERRGRSEAITENKINQRPLLTEWQMKRTAVTPRDWEQVRRDVAPERKGPSQVLGVGVGMSDPQWSEEHDPEELPTPAGGTWQETNYGRFHQSQKDPAKRSKMWSDLKSAKAQGALSKPQTQSIGGLRFAAFVEKKKEEKKLFQKEMIVRKPIRMMKKVGKTE